MFIVQINDNNILQEILYIGTDRRMAENHFLDACRTHISNWGEYTVEDVTVILEQGYEQFGNRAVVLIDTSNHISDADVASLIMDAPTSDVDKIVEWVQSGEIKEVSTITEAMVECGRCLDASNSWDICGQVLFKAEDGKWYTINTEAVVGEADPAFVKETLEEMKQFKREMSHE